MNKIHHRKRRHSHLSAWSITKVWVKDEKQKELERVQKTERYPIGETRSARGNGRHVGECGQRIRTSGLCGERRQCGQRGLGGSSASSAKSVHGRRSSGRGTKHIVATAGTGADGYAAKQIIS